MKFLLDTHTLLWGLFSPDQLGRKARATMEDPSRDVYASAISYWEISLKFSMGKLDLPGTFPTDIPPAVEEIGFRLAPLTPDLLASYHQLGVNKNHRDPFDRLLIWQSIQSGYVLLSKDKRLTAYANAGLRTLW